jgi:hypothetical protein
LPAFELAGLESDLIRRRFVPDEEQVYQGPQFSHGALE